MSLTKTWTRAYFLRLEEERLKRLERLRAPEPSTRWAKQQIAYLRSNKPYNLSRTILIGRIPGCVQSFVQTAVHEWCVSMFREEEENSSTSTLQGPERVRIPLLDPEPVLKPEVECLLQEAYYLDPWIKRVFDPGGP